MDIALEVISVQATAPSTGAAFTAVTGDTLQVRDARAAKLVSMWGTRQADGIFRLTSPLLHDAVVGIQQQIENAQTIESFFAVPQKLTPQDSLIAFGSGSSTAGNIESNSIQIAYEGLAGICGKFISVEQLMSNAVELYNSNNGITLGSSGGYSGSELLNAEQDQLKANQDYAIIGMTHTGTSDLNTVGYVSPDWGNLRVGIPAINSNPGQSSNYFARLSMAMKMPLIPVFNASQKSSVFIDVNAAENSSGVEITTHMVRLKPGVIFGGRSKK